MNGFVLWIHQLKRIFFFTKDHSLHLHLIQLNLPTWNEKLKKVINLSVNYIVQKIRLLTLSDNKLCFSILIMNKRSNNILKRLKTTLIVINNITYLKYQKANKFLRKLLKKKKIIFLTHWRTISIFIRHQKKCQLH